MKKKLFPERVIACFFFSSAILSAFWAWPFQGLLLVSPSHELLHFLLRHSRINTYLNRIEVKCCLASTRIPHRFRFKTFSALIVWLLFWVLPCRAKAVDSQLLNLFWVSLKLLTVWIYRSEKIIWCDCRLGRFIHDFSASCNKNSFASNPINSWLASRHLV